MTTVFLDLMASSITLLAITSCLLSVLSSMMIPPCNSPTSALNLMLHSPRRCISRKPRCPPAFSRRITINFLSNSSRNISPVKAREALIILIIPRFLLSSDKAILPGSWEVSVGPTLSDNTNSGVETVKAGEVFSKATRQPCKSTSSSVQLWYRLSGDFSSNLMITLDK